VEPVALSAGARVVARAVALRAIPPDGHDIRGDAGRSSHEIRVAGVGIVVGWGPPSCGGVRVGGSGDPREIDDRLEETPRLPLGRQDTVELGLVEAPTAHERRDGAIVEADRHERRLQRLLAAPRLQGPVRALELPQAVGDGPLGDLLAPRVNRREDAERALPEIRAVLGLEILADEIDDVGPRTPRRGGRGLPDANRLAHRPLGLALGDRARLGHHVQHGVAAFARTVGVEERVVQARSPDQPGEEGRLPEREIPDLLPEVVPGGATESVHGGGAVLTQVDLVEVGPQDSFLRVVQLEDERGERLGGLARQRPLPREVEVLRELLCQRASPLGHSPRGDIHPEGAEYPRRVDPRVVEEPAILGDEDRVDELLRAVLDPHELPLLEVGALEDRERLGLEERGAGGDVGQDAAAEGDANPLRRMVSLEIPESAEVDLERVAARRVRARVGRAAPHPPVIEPIQPRLELLRRRLHPVLEAERRPEEPGCRLLLPRLEAGGDAPGDPDGPGDSGRQADQPQEEKALPEMAPASDQEDPFAGRPVKRFPGRYAESNVAPIDAATSSSGKDAPAPSIVARRPRWRTVRDRANLAGLGRLGPARDGIPLSGARDLGVQRSGRPE